MHIDSRAGTTRVSPVRTAMDILTTPFRGDALVVNLAFALVLGPLFFFMSHAGPVALYGIPAVIILVPWFLRYCLVVGRQAAYGHRETPPFTLENVNPLELQLIVLVIGLAVLSQALALALGPAAAVIALALVAPAAIAILVVEEYAHRALNPVVLARYVAGLGPAYPALAALLGGGLWLCVLALGSAWGAFGTVLAVQSALLATLHGIGRLLHAREFHIGYERPETPAERRARRAQEAARRALEDKLAEAYLLAEANRSERALETLLAHVREQGDDPGLYAAVLERLLAWRHPTMGPAFARHYVDRLHHLGKHARSLQVFLRVFDIEPVVRPIGADTTLRLARLAHEAKRDDVALALVADFEERFPQSRLLPAALLEHARLLFTERGEAVASAAILERLEREHPEVMDRNDVRRLRDRVVAAKSTAAG